MNRQTNLPSEQELQSYLHEKGVEKIFATLLEGICFFRPDNIPQFVVDHMTKYYGASTTHPSSLPFSQQMKPSQDKFGPSKKDEKTTTSTTQTTNDYENFHFGSSPQDVSFHPFSFLSSNQQKDVQQTSQEDDEEDEIVEDNMMTDIDFQQSESIRRRYSVSFDRRGGVSSESINVDDAKNFKRVVIQKSEDERRRLEQACSNLVLFKNLEEEELSILYDAMFEKNYKAGEIIVNQGEEGKYFYVVDTGECEVLKKTGDQEPQLVNTIQSGGSFGELALIFGTPRAATVRAKTDVKLWVIDRITYRTVLMTQTQKKRNLYETFLKQCPLLKSLTDYERDTIADALVPEAFKDGDIIVKQGEPGHSFYIIVEGDVVCLKDEGMKMQELVKLHQSDYFGELALILDQPRACTVKAVGPVKTVKLDRRSFKQLLGPAEDILKRNMEHYNKYISTKL